MTEGERWRDLARFSSAGVEFIGIFGLMLGGGLLLDRWLGLLPVFTIWGGVIGFFVALRWLVKQAKQAGQADRSDQPDNDDD